MPPPFYTENIITTLSIQYDNNSNHTRDPCTFINIISLVYQYNHFGISGTSKGSANLKMIVVFFQSSNVIASTMERPLLLCFNVKIEVLSPSRQNIALSFKKFALVSLNNKQTSSHFYFPRQSWENAMRLDRIISI